MPTPSRTGTPAQIDASAASGSTNVSVPSDCNLIVAFWAHWDNNGNSTLSTLTLNGVSFFPAQAQVAEGAITDATGTGVAILVNPSTGTQTVAWGWSSGGARTEGGGLFLVFYKDGNTSNPVRSSGANHTTGTSTAPVSLNGTQTSDRVVGFVQNYSTQSPVISGVTAFLDNITINSEAYDVGDATNLSGTVAISNTNPYFTSTAAVSLIASTGGTSVNVGLVTETDTSQALSVKSSFTSGLGLVSETDIAQVVNKSTPFSAALGSVIETDLAQVISSSSGSGGLLSTVFETDAAQTIQAFPSINITVNTAFETNIAQAITANFIRNLALTIVFETDLSQTITRLGDFSVRSGLSRPLKAGVSGSGVTAEAHVTEDN